MTQMTIHICGPEAGTTKALRCGCCGFETDDFEEMAVSICWACSFGNPECRRCLESGSVLASKFRGGTKSHLVVRKTKRSLTTACGRLIEYGDSTGGMTKPICRKCDRAWERWPRRLP